MKFARNLSITVICVILGVMVAWQYKSIDNNKKYETNQNNRLDKLIDDLSTERKANENLRNRNKELEKQVSEWVNAKGNIDKIEASIKEELERAKILSGLVGVKGKGVIITLDDGDEYSKVSERDLLYLINELRASEAQAISVNEERIIAMSEIKQTGDYIVINGRQLKHPFTVKAIAEPEKLENALKMLGGILETFEDYYGLKVSMEKKDSIIIPKVRDDGSVIKHNLLSPTN
ncbi:MAG: DUF881 domain-containing protein [Bacillota bacterium]